MSGAFDPEKVERFQDDDEHGEYDPCVWASDYDQLLALHLGLLKEHDDMYGSSILD